MVSTIKLTTFVKTHEKRLRAISLIRERITELYGEDRKMIKNENKFCHKECMIGAETAVPVILRLIMQMPLAIQLSSK